MLCAVRDAVSGETVERLGQVWRDFAESECGTYSPLYAAISHSVADDPELLALAAAAPPTGQQPNVLLAADSPVAITCDLRGTAPVPARLPAIAARLGIDRSPVDITKADDARWLLACVWPDTGRLDRTAAAMELARRHPPKLISGDMVTDLDAALDTFDLSLPIVVVTTSACGYLSVEQRHAFLAALERRARRQPLAWLSADAPGIIDIVPIPPTIGHAGASASVMGLVTFETGTAVGRALGLCHAHGAWMEWADTQVRRA